MGITVSTNANVIAADLGHQGYRMTRRLMAVVQESGVDMRDEWRANATETAGEHGRWYPRSINVHRAGALTVRVGPDEGARQGGMSFEFGSRNQPPHLDGQRALDTLHKLIERRLEAALVF